MKIAILFSGRLNKNIGQRDNLISSLYQSNDVDIFVSHSKYSDSNTAKDFVEIYKPTKIIENDETYLDISKYPKRPETNSHNTMCMFKNRLNAYKLMKEYTEQTKTNYDIVISCRLDLYWHQNINYSDLLPHINNDYVCIPNPKWDYTGINDQFAIGNMSTMGIYMGVYDSLYNILESGVIIHPETLLLNHLKKNNVKIHRFEINYNINRNA